MVRLGGCAKEKNPHGMAKPILVPCQLCNSFDTLLYNFVADKISIQHIRVGYAAHISFLLSSVSCPGLLPTTFTVLVQKSTQFQCIPCSLINVLESVRAKVNPTKVARDDDKNIAEILSSLSISGDISTLEKTGSQKSQWN